MKTTQQKQDCFMNTESFFSTKSSFLLIQKNLTFKRAHKQGGQSGQTTPHLSAKGSAFAGERK